MTFYEELGVSASAGPEEIRKAHRTLSRLLHPDQQTDGALRSAAELQMRRVNQIIDILLDPQQRRKYDESLRTPPRIIALPAPLPRPNRSRALSFFAWIGVVTAAAVVTLLAIWAFADDFIHWDTFTASRTAAEKAAPASSYRDTTRRSERLVQHVPVQKRSVPPNSTTSPSLEPGPAMDPPPVRKEEPLHSSSFTMRAGTSRLSLKPSSEHRQTRLDLDEPTTVFVPPPPALVIAPPPETMKVPPSFAGLWLLPSGRIARNLNHARQAPQYIQISIHKGRNDTIYGEYAARYEVPDQPISPEVAFTFGGPVTGDSASFDWDARDGSRGAVELKLLNPQSMQVTWRVTEFGTRIGITGGAAVVIRKAE